MKKDLGLNIKKEEVYIIPVFIPHRGCKNECVFCNQRKISGELRSVTAEDVENTIEEHLVYYKKNPYKKIQVAFFGGSFTGLDISEQEDFLNIAEKYIKDKKIGSIRISTRPDYINEEVLNLLKKKHVRVIELGVQSMINSVLLTAKRGHTKEDVIKASKLIKKYGFKLGHQIMIGLPDSTEEMEIETIKGCIKLKPDMIRIYPVYTLKDSELYSMYEAKKYIPLNVEDSINRTTEVYKECIKAKLNVIRVGLQTTTEINSDNKDIVGPVVENYKERILSKIAIQVIENKIKNNKLTDILEIYAPKEQVNYIVGAKKENKKYMQEKYKIKVRVNKK